MVELTRFVADAQHLRYGLSLMNRWASDGGNPFLDATWDEAWKIVAALEFNGVVGSIAHLAYHLGAIRQINKTARGPKEGTFP